MGPVLDLIAAPFRAIGSALTPNIDIPQLPPQAPPPTRDTAQVDKAAKEARERARRAEGRASTILTDVDLELDENGRPKKKQRLGA